MQAFLNKYFSFVLCLLLCLIAFPLYAQESLTLTLNDAILLAVRKNPNVESIRLRYLSTKYALIIQDWDFYPHYSLGLSGAFTRDQTKLKIFRTQNADIQPGVSLKTPIGTKINFAPTNMGVTDFRPGLSLEISQPLMRGFGRAIVQAALNNARDNLVIARLNVEGTLRTTVSQVIEAYLNVISAERTVQIDEEALQRAKLSVEHTKKFIKAGHKAGNELVTVEANVASAEAQLENDRNALLQTRYAFLTAIGINPNTQIQVVGIDFKELKQKYHQPTLEETKIEALKNDIQFQVDILTLEGQLERSLAAAIDNTRWEMNFTLKGVSGKGIGGTYAQQFDDDQNPNTPKQPQPRSLLNGAYQGQEVGLTINIPLDDQAAKQGVFDAKLAIKEARMNLRKERWQKETDAINAWHSVLSAQRSLHFAQRAEILQKKTYQISYQKYTHGLIDSLELQSAQVQLIQSQASLLNAEISYIKALVSLDLLLGHTLKTWDIKVRV